MMFGCFSFIFLPNSGTISAVFLFEKECLWSGLGYDVDMYCICMGEGGRGEYYSLGFIEGIIV